MERNIKIAAVGDNCMDVYDSLGVSYPGGNPVNVAVYIKRLGGEASYTGVVGNDESGIRLREALAEKGVDISHVHVAEGKTAVSHVEIINGDRVFGTYEEGVLADFSLIPEDLEFIASHDLLVTGIWGMIEGELPGIKKKGLPVAFDFANKFAHPVVERAIPYVDYAFFSFDKASVEDFNRTYRAQGLPGREQEGEKLREYMKAVQSRGPRVVTITLGERGSTAFDGERFYECGVVPCEVVDTMGAGDSFIAGFLYGLLKGGELKEAMEAGAKNSSVTLGYSGAW